MEQKTNTRKTIMSTPTATTTVPALTAPLSSRFETTVAAFATKVGLPLEAVTKTLLDKAINDATDESLAILGSATDVEDSMWGEMFPSVKKPVLRNAYLALRATVFPPAAPVAAAPAPVAAPSPVSNSPATPFRGLAPLADDGAFLKQLTVGGRLNGTVSAVDAVNAVRVGMANSIGIFDVPEKLAERIEEWSNTMEMPADDRVYALLNSIRERRYAEVLEPLGVGSRAVSEKGRKEFVSRLSTTLWPGLRRFHAALKGWYDGWMAQSSNPATMMNFMASMVSGGVGMMPGVMATPDVGVLRSAHSELVTMTNRLYSGTYMVPVSRAMAYDALRIVGQLNDPGLAAAAGVPNRDELLRLLRVGVTDSYARSERAVAQYTLNALEMGSQTDTELPAFAGALYLLGAAIAWDDLGTDRIGHVQEDRPATKRREVIREDSSAAFAPFPNGTSRGSR